MDYRCTAPMLFRMAHWVYNYQTLLTGILAVIAALYAARFAQKQVNATNAQIAAANDQAVRERAAKLRAARASLPTALSAICEYAQSAGQALYAAWPQAAKLYPDDHDQYRDQRVKASIPEFPTGLLRTLENVVEFTDAEDVAARIESILREVQVFASRTRPLFDGIDISTHLLATHIVQAAALYARAESLFTYARKKSDGVNSADLWERTFAALSIMMIQEQAVLTEARHQRDSGQLPGEADTEEPW